jgi:AGCS family alanine or glycine:cation symporter
MFQAWNVAEVSVTYFGLPRPLVGAVLALAVAAVIIGGIRRIGRVTSIFVPLMCLIYLTAGVYVIAVNIAEMPAVFQLVFASAFAPTEITGAFVGGSVGAAMLWGMKRALYSSEIGQGSSAIAHCAVKTDEPVREGIVAGLEPFIDTLVVCTITGLVILVTGVWNRAADVHLEQPPATTALAANLWQVDTLKLPNDTSTSQWLDDSSAFMIWSPQGTTEADKLQRWYGTVRVSGTGVYLSLNPLEASSRPVFRDAGVYQDYAGASLTALAFNQVHEGLGKWLVTIAAWMFAFSTIVAWAYYGEQAYVYLFGARTVPVYKWLYCAATLIATLGFMRTNRELDAITTTGTGLVLISSMVITLLFGHKAIAAYKAYVARLSSGKLADEYHAARLADVVSGKAGITK